MLHPESLTFGTEHDQTFAMDAASKVAAEPEEEELAPVRLGEPEDNFAVGIVHLALMAAQNDAPGLDQTVWDMVTSNVKTALKDHHNVESGAESLAEFPRLCCVCGALQIRLQSVSVCLALQNVQSALLHSLILVFWFWELLARNESVAGMRTRDCRAAGPCCSRAQPCCPCVRNVKKIGPSPVSDCLPLKLSAIRCVLSGKRVRTTVTKTSISFHLNQCVSA